MHRAARTLLTCLLVTMTACSGAEPAATPTPTAPPGVAGVTPAPLQSPTPLPDVGGPTAGATEPLGQQQAPPQCETASESQTTTCTTVVFAPRLTLELPTGWMPDPGNPDLPNSSSYMTEDETGYLSFTRASQVFEYDDGGPPRTAPAPADLPGFLAGLPASEAGVPEPVSVAGQDGTQIDVTITDTSGLQPPQDCGPPQDALYVFDLEEAVCEPFFLPPDEIVRFVVLESNTGGDPLIISMEASPPDTHSAVFADLEAILQSLQIEEPF